MLFGPTIFHSDGLGMWQTGFCFFGLGFDWQIMALPSLFFLALHGACNRHPSHQFVASGNNYMGSPEVKPGREESERSLLVTRQKGGGERSGRAVASCYTKEETTTTQHCCIAKSNTRPSAGHHSPLHPIALRNLRGRQNVRTEGRLLMRADRLRPGV